MAPLMQHLHCFLIVACGQKHFGPLVGRSSPAYVIYIIYVVSAGLGIFRNFNFWKYSADQALI